MSSKKNKGQVTVYIALALIVLALLAAILYYRQVQVQTELEAGVKKIAVAPEAEPMQAFITSCLEKTAIEGVEIIAAHGGYITVPGRIDQARPTEGEAVTLSPFSDQAIPYWHFLSSPNNCKGKCEFAGLQPPLKKPSKDSIESQLDKYITDNIGACIDGFNMFKEQGYSVMPMGQITVSSTITDSTVAVYATYPVRFERENNAVQTNDVFTAVPARLGEMYNLASDITRLQRENRFLERHLRQLIDMQSGLGQAQLPPIYEVEFRIGTGKAWAKSQVKGQIQGLLSTYIPFLQVFGTANYRKVIAPANTDKQLFDMIYNRNMIIVASEKEGYPIIESRFSYLPWWDPYFELNCQGELCRPESLVNTLGIAYGIQRYLFSYDASFPVMVELRDPDAFSGKGLSLVFMLEANLRANRPLQGDFNPIKMEPGTGDILFCDPGQLTGTNLSLTLIDGGTGKPVEDADMIYTCGPADHENSSSCSIGATGENGRIASRLPVCIGGTLSLLKEGYVTTYIPFDSDEKVTKPLTALIEPKRIINIDTERIRLQKVLGGWRIEDSPVSLDPYEEASVIMRKKAGPYDDEFYVMAQQIGDVVEDVRSGMHTNIEVVPGNYTVEISTLLTPSTPVVIPADRRCYEGQCIDAPKEPIAFDSTKPLPLGGASYTYEIKKADLDNHKTLKLYAVDISIDTIPEQERKIEDLDQIGNIETTSVVYRKQIEPKWE